MADGKLGGGATPPDISILQTPSPDEAEQPILRRLAEGEMFAARYKVARLIGEGGAGSVYCVLDARTGREIALKLIRADRTAGPEARARLVAEAVTARDIRHESVVAVYDVDEWRGQPFMTMELLNGRSLRTYLRDLNRRDEPCSFAVASGIVLQTLSALEAVHGRGAVHRDLKPENIYLLGDPDSESGVRVKLLDFGLAHVAGSGVAASGPSGTPHYMAPEQITSPDTVRPSADLYALSVMFYELLAGVLPHGPFWQAPGEGRNDVPTAIDDLIRRGLSGNPRGRPQNAAEYRKAIEAALREGTADLKVERKAEGPTAEPRPILGPAPAGLGAKLAAFWERARKGDPEGLYKVAFAYANGKVGLTQDDREAARLYRLAANLGHVRAQVNLGSMYVQGLGVAQDHREAVRLFCLAADQGDARAQFNLGVMYGQGRGVAKDEREAVRWYRLSAKQGDANAQAALKKRGETW